MHLSWWNTSCRTEVNDIKRNIMKECTEDETKKNRVGLGTCNGEGVTIFEDSVIVGVEPYLKGNSPKLLLMEGRQA